MAARPLLDPYKATPPPRTGPPVPNMGGFAPPAAAQPRSFVAAAPMAAAARPGPVPQPAGGGFTPPKYLTQAIQGFGQQGPPTNIPTGPPAGTPPPTAPNVPAPPLGQDPTHGHFPVPQAGQPQQSANAAVATANANLPAKPLTTAAKTGGGGGGPAGNPQEQKASNDILTWLNRMITGKGNFPVQMMKNDLLRATTGREKVAEDAINSDAVARGLYRSGVAGRNVAEAQRGAAADYSSGVRDILEKKAMSDTQTRMQALGMKQNWLEALRNADYRKQQMAMAGRSSGPDMINYTDAQGNQQQMDPRMLELFMRYGDQI